MPERTDEARRPRVSSSGSTSSTPRSRLAADIPGGGQATSPALLPTRASQRPHPATSTAKAVDEAKTVAVVPADVSCKRNGDVYTRMEWQQVDVGFGSGQALDQTLTRCQPCLTGCLVFAGTDLDGDGRDELAIDVGPGAATDSWSSSASMRAGSARPSSPGRPRSPPSSRLADRRCLVGRSPCPFDHVDRQGCSCSGVSQPESRGCSSWLPLERWLASPRWSCP
jgi:hypothetical protein